MEGSTMKLKRSMAVIAAAIMACSMCGSVTVSAASKDTGRVYSDEAYVVDEGWVYVGDDTYYIQADGSFKTGWLESNTGNRYYFGSDGKMIKSQWLKFKNGAKYYFAANGKMYSDKWLELANGARRYFKTNGRMAVNCKLKIDGAIYTFDSKGNVTKKIPRQDIYVSRTNGIYHYDHNCDDDVCYETTLSTIKGKGIRACPDCVD